MLIGVWNRNRVKYTDDEMNAHDVPADDVDAADVSVLVSDVLVPAVSVLVSVSVPADELSNVPADELSNVPADADDEVFNVPASLVPASLVPASLVPAPLVPAEFVKGIVYDPTRFSETELKTGQKIIKNIFDGILWIILLAQMQSGKTDTYYFVAAELLRQKKYEKCIIISGNSNIDMKEQLKNTGKFYIKYTNYLKEECNFTEDVIATIIEYLQSKIDVKFGADLDENKNGHSAAKNTLFIWEESHFAQSKRNRPNKYLERLKITADGNPKNLAGERNNAVISVSATCFSEISDLLHDTQHKKIVKMSPSMGYTGVGDYLRKNLIKGINDLTKELPAILQKHAPGNPKVAFIRLTGRNTKIFAIVQCILDNGWDVLYYDSKTNTINKKNNIQQSLDDLTRAPTRNTVILVNNMLRMGMRINNKNNIAFVIEPSRSSNTDVMCQGLLGRMCGYGIHPDIEVYIHENILTKKTGIDDSTELEKYVRIMESDDDNVYEIPTIACNLVKNSTAVQYYEILPIVIKKAEVADNDTADNDTADNDAAAGRAAADNDAAADNESFREKTIRTVKEAFQHGNIINENSDAQTEEVIEQIRAMPDKPDNADRPDHIVAIHQILENNKTFKDVPKRIAEAIETNSLNVAESIRRMPGCGYSSLTTTQTNIWVFRTDKFRDIGFPSGSIVVQARTKNTSEVDIRKTLRKVPKTTGLEAFSTRHEDGTTVVGNGSYSVSAPVDTFDKVVAMTNYVEDVVKLSLVQISSQIMPRCFTSNQAENSTWKGILVTAEVLVSLEKNGVVYEYIKENYGLLLKVHKMCGKPTSACRQHGYTRLTKVEW